MNKNEILSSLHCPTFSTARRCPYYTFACCSCVKNECLRNIEMETVIQHKRGRTHMDSDPGYNYILGLGSAAIHIPPLPKLGFHV